MRKILELLWVFERVSGNHDMYITIFTDGSGIVYYGTGIEVFSFDCIEHGKGKLRKYIDNPPI